MTREEAAKWAELYQAYADGKVIQVRIHDGSWREWRSYNFDLPVTDYRIKPEPKKAEFWVNVYGEHFGATHPSKQDADAAGRVRTACLHIVREYEEGEGL